MSPAEATELLGDADVSLSVPAKLTPDGVEFRLTADDVKQLAIATLAHRVVLAPGAEIEGIDTRTAIRDIVSAVEAPR